MLLTGILPKQGEMATELNVRNAHKSAFGREGTNKQNARNKEVIYFTIHKHFSEEAEKGI